MSSLAYQIKHFSEAVIVARRYNREHTRLKRQAEALRLPLPKQRMPTDQSVDQYINDSVRFGTWCQSTHSVKRWEHCKPHIQEYADYLVAAGKTASTIHTYLTGICFVWQVPLATIHKPIRHAADATRSRGKKVSDSRNDRHRNPTTKHVFDFHFRVGTRAHDDWGMRKDALVKDESGYWCVFIRHGKGGKPQKQRLLPSDLIFVRPYFDGTADFVFSKDELKHKLDLHHLRALVAQRAYRYYCDRLATESGYRQQLTLEIWRRWATYNHKKWDPRCTLGTIHLRGYNRRFALVHGLPTAYDRLAVMAVSVFHLSHWRTNVAIAHYLLAYSPDEPRFPQRPEDVA